MILDIKFASNILNKFFFKDIVVVFYSFILSCYICKYYYLFKFVKKIEFNKVYTTFTNLLYENNIKKICQKRNSTHIPTHFSSIHTHKIYVCKYVCVYNNNTLDRFVTFAKKGKKKNYRLRTFVKPT